MKKKLSLICLLLITVFTLTAFSACVSTSAPAMEEYWYTNCTFSKDEANEKCVYDVNFVANSGSNDEVAVTKMVGTYTTIFSSYFDETLKTVVHELSTSLIIEGKYSVGKEFTDDYVKTYCKFLTVDDRLMPLESRREVKAHTLSFVDEAYVENVENYKVETVYSDNGNAATSQYFNLATSSQATTREFNNLLDDKMISVDNEQYLFAIRSVNFAETTSYAFKDLDTVSQKQQELAVKCSSVTDETYSFEYQGATLTNQTIKTCKLTSAINSDKFSGGISYFYFAKRTTPVNTYCNLLLRMEVPLSHKLGVLDYTIKSAEKSSSTFVIG